MSKQILSAGAGKIDITPKTHVLMDGMPRAHLSEGVHDPLFARAMVLINNENKKDICIIVSADICGITENDANIIRETVSKKHGIPKASIIIAATHTHSGPATIGYFNPIEPEYIKELIEKIMQAIDLAMQDTKPALAGCATGRETTINHYRRLMADDGSVIMNWEDFPAERIVKPLGETDTRVGVLKVVEADSPDKLISLLFNFPCHPNVLSGDNYLISADFPGLAEKLLEEEFGCPAMFINGALGTMDIDGLKDRDLEGIVRTGTALAKAVSDTAKKIKCADVGPTNVSSIKYSVPKRKITDKELEWAEEVLRVTTDGALEVMRDGVGDDYKAGLYKKLHDSKETTIEIEQVGFAIAGAAFITFPGEVFTEIGLDIQKKSPIKPTFCLGLVNGSVGYLPTNKAISEGGYAVDTRSVNVETEDILIKKSLTLLKNLCK